MIRLLPIGAACLVVGCLALSAGCAGSQEADGANPPETTQETTAGADAGSRGPTGTDGKDVLRAGDGDQVVRGLGGDDELYGGEGRDRLYGGPGDDVIDAQDPGSVGEAGRDEISCGPGRDEVLMDANDGERPRDCEMVTEGSS